MVGYRPAQGSELHFPQLNWIAHLPVARNYITWLTSVLRQMGTDTFFAPLLVASRYVAKKAVCPHLSPWGFVHVHDIGASSPCPPQTHESPEFPQGFVLILIGQLPTLPHTRACSTIGAEGLNFRVRDGNGWNPLATVTQSVLNCFGELLLNIDGHCHKEKPNFIRTIYS